MHSAETHASPGLAHAFGPSTTPSQSLSCPSQISGPLGAHWQYVRPPPAGAGGQSLRPSHAFVQRSFEARQTPLEHCAADVHGAPKSVGDASVEASPDDGPSAAPGASGALASAPAAGAFDVELHAANAIAA